MNSQSRLLSFVHFLSIAVSVASLCVCVQVAHSAPPDVQVWGMAEVSFRGPQNGNPFVDVDLKATFTQGRSSFTVRGFYDGAGTYKVRFMPNAAGTWNYRTTSNAAALANKSGQVRVLAAAKGNHGPVRVKEKFHFAFADGSAYYPFGTTIYAMVHQPAVLQEQTLASLAKSPFNKLRICVFPKWYEYNHTEPPLLPFVHKADGFPDPTQPNPAYWRMLEARIMDLQRMGVEVDLILFHPYDESKKPGQPVHWGYDNMPPDANKAYLRYLAARLGAFRNVWWSMANEWDFVGGRSVEQWNELFDVLEQEDPYEHLTSIHNGAKFFDHTRRSITHTSVQAADTTKMLEWRNQYAKPVIDDECQYEGNIESEWGNITGEELSHRFWDGFVRGGYVGHGETFHAEDEVLWWSKGGVLKGESPARIGFLRKIVESCGPLEPVIDKNTRFVQTPVARCGDSFLIYLGEHRPALTGPGLLRKVFGVEPALKNARWRFELIDTWAMTQTPAPGEYSGEFTLRLPGRPYVAVRATPIRVKAARK